MEVLSGYCRDGLPAVPPSARAPGEGRGGSESRAISKPPHLPAFFRRADWLRVNDLLPSSYATISHG